MTQKYEMPGEIWAFNNCFPDDPGTYALNPHHGGQSYIRRAVTKEEAGEALKWRDGIIDRDFVKWALAHESLIRKLLESYK